MPDHPALNTRGYIPRAFAPFSLTAAPGSIFCRGLVFEGKEDALVFFVSPATSKRARKLNIRHCSLDEWHCYRDWSLAQTGEAEGWFYLRNWNVSACQAVDLRANHWIMECAEQSTHQLTWRTDLDGYLELAPMGQSYKPSIIHPVPNERLFGWLHPASEFPFDFEGLGYRHCCWSGWPFPHRQLFCARHGLPKEAARDPHWFDKPQDSAVWANYLQAVASRLQNQEGWQQRFSALELPVAAVDDETQILLMSGIGVEPSRVVI